MLFIGITLYSQERVAAPIGSASDVNTNFVQIPRVDVDFLEAEKLFFDNKYYVARAAFMEYLRKNPLSKNDMLYFYLGTTYFIDKDYKEAIKYYKIALDLKNLPSYYNNIGNACYQMKDYREAILWYTDAAKRLYSPYTISTNMNTLYNLAVSTNILTNASFQNQNILIELEDKVSDIRSNMKNFADSSAANSALSNEGKQNKSAAIDPRILFQQMTVFTNIVTTNTTTNYIPYTNITLTFSPNTSENISNIPNFDIDTNITKSIYYSPYLHLGHTYLELSQFTNAALSYEIFLTNVDRSYYQFNQIEKVISVIRSGNIGLNNTQKSINEKVLTNSDGTVITEKYSEGVITERDALKPDGTLTTTMFYKDGSVVQKSYLSDGNIITETSTLYGVREVAQNKPDGSVIRTVISRDGSQFVYSLGANGSEYSYSAYPDGSVITKIIDEKSETVLIERTDGSISRRTLDEAGVVRIYTLNGDGSEVERMEYPKDKVVTFTKHTDGTVVNRTENIDGSMSSVSKRADGTTTTITIDTNKIATTKTVYPDGAEVTRIIDEKDVNANAILISETIGLDGSRISRTIDADGTVKTTTKKTDGSIITEIANKDGTTEMTSTKTDGSFVSTKTYAGGIRETTTSLLDGTRISETMNPDGSSVSMVFSNTGVNTTTTREKDGSVKIEVVELTQKSTTLTKPDGTRETDIEKADGTVINIKNEKDKTVTTVKTGGNIIVLTEGNGKTDIKAKDILGADIIDMNVVFEMLKNALGRDVSSSIQTTDDIGALAQ